ncbi:cysteine dioxygenase [Legionella cincinnatiensis]|uniref:Cysteine dioxygenase type I n=1 Tax=Legionella cincinnatiensis TaxID=28085 RepID=A0A378IN39_9GAMM|nr:cysteine dioxygenase [Legionella cincinnatiensis]KTC88437.1 Cysteine dioxygenase type I [Legionella cincinnatiensis]STX36075.1 Predicted metal-dependent enzyme of the double-stranded beta helix superfamily [Legionella cincinnatiensis]
MQDKIEFVREANREKIVKAMNELEVVNYETVSKHLPRLLAEGALHLDHSVYTPADPSTNLPKGVGRYLLYDHDSSNPFSIWVFAFAPRQKTTIHDHKYKGTVTVLEGPISEKFYQPTGEKSAQLVNRIDRYRFHSNSDDLTSTFVHQLKCRKGLDVTISVTLHIYNMEAYLVHFDGKKIDQRNLNIIYSKDKTGANKNIPSYTKVSSDLDEPISYKI